MTAAEAQQTPAAAAPSRTRSIEVPVRVAVPGDARARRSGEPVSVGVPLPRGAWRTGQRIALRGPAGDVPLQAEVLESWADGSARWVLIDFAADAPADYTLVCDRGTLSFQAADGIRARQETRALSIVTGDIVFRVPRRGPFRIETTPGADVAASSLALSAIGADGQPLATDVQDARLESAGPIRTVALVSGTIGPARQPRLRFTARVHFFRGSAVVRCELTLTNPAAAGHPGGCWELGDAGSVLIRDVSLRLTAARECRGAFCRPEPGIAPSAGPFAFELVQESSGGEHWQSPVHRNRDNQVPMQHRGYRLRASGREVTGLRATPVAWMDVENGRLALAMEHFWQNFPKALECRGRDLVLRLFPQGADLHEFQGGEQKTHVFHAAFGRDTVTAEPLAWAGQPALAAPGPDWFARAEAVPYLAPANRSAPSLYDEMVGAALDGPDSFEAKRERIDEYGWRNFGDIYADHETVHAKEPAPVVSHYNNQYDAIAGFACQFMRSGDPRWWRGMAELAGHVADVDIYHTDADKAAYNGGLFWHTCHYRDAGRSTHRSYPRADGIAGGGPANEHAYSTGLMLHYFLTGCRQSREAAIGLADWILRLDDGRLTMFRWLTRRETGLASVTASQAYHGPGRGAGNAITVLLNAYRLTGNRAYQAKAEALIRRTIHPADDIAARELLDAERRWSYTVYLQALGHYLDDKVARGELDEAYAYGRASLLHYARWMVEHEYPYLDRPDLLEYPTETWAAQDMRKSEALLYAARHAPEAERGAFVERATFFYDASLGTLRQMPTRTLARPLVILMTCGFRLAGFLRAAPAPEPAVDAAFGSPARFEPQKAVARRRARIVAGAGLLTGALTAAGLLISIF